MPQIRGGQITDDSIESVDIKDGTIVDADISASAAIDQSKIDQTSGWISDLNSTAAGVSKTLVDTDSGNVDGSMYIPQTPDDGERWFVKNNGTSGNKVYDLPWEVELQDGMFMEFLAFDGVWVPNFASFNSATEQFVDKFNAITGEDTATASVTNIWGDGTFMVTGSVANATGTTEYGFTFLVDTTNPGAYPGYMTGLQSTDITNSARLKYLNGVFSAVDNGTWTLPLINRIRKLEDATKVESSYKIKDGYVELWSDFNYASTSSNKELEVEDGRYEVLISDNGRIYTAEVRVVTASGNTVFDGSFGSGANVDYTSTTHFWSTGVGTYHIVSIRKYNGIMTVKHDFKRVVRQATFPLSPELGDECYRTDIDEWYKYNGEVWTQF